MTQPEPLDPAAQPVPPLDERWPGWAVDEWTAMLGAAALAAAMAAAVPAVALAAALAAWAVAYRPGDPVPDVAAWLAEQIPVDYLAAELEPALADIAAEGTLIGRRSARAVVELLEAGGDPRAVHAQDDPAAGVTLTVDWGGWEPGHPEAARQMLSSDGVTVHLADLLAADGIELTGIAGNRLNDIAAVLADGLEQGRSPQEVADALRGVIDDPVWAYMTAVTELNRATSAATLAEYEESGIPAKGWMTAFDQRVCKWCKGDEEAGAIALGAKFPSGRRHPPGHPRCRCALIPELELTVTKAARPDGGRDLKHYWTKGEGLARWIGSPHPWTALYHHLKDHMADDMAKRTASRWFHDVTGMWPGERKGKNPTGRG